MQCQIETKMLKTLHGKLSLVLLFLLILSGLILVPLLFRTTRAYNEEVSQNLNRELATDLAKHLGAQGLLKEEFPNDERLRTAAGKEISSLMTLNRDIEIYILDTKGHILSASLAPNDVKRQNIDLRPIQNFILGTALPIYGPDPRQHSGSKVFSAARILPQAGSLNGYIYIILGGQNYDAQAAMLHSSYALRVGTWSIGGVLGVTFLAAFIMFAGLTRRLRRLTHEVEAFGAQTMTPSDNALPTARHDEIKALETVFARMAGRIGAQVRTLEEVDARRREAVSNVSHDLRTPLAALQGYLETLLMKAGQLPREEEKQYLTTALKHAERLGKLISALFELAKLDSREMQPQREPFSLAELAQDVVQHFSLAAQNKNLQLKMQCAETLPFVYADIALVERALSNLIENALRHTPPDGRITIGLQPQNQQVLVTVQDNGAGIAPEDLPHIFERTYRTHDGARNHSDDTGSGLGLAIAKRIIELHDGQIAAKSTLGQGATFSFTLPLVANE